MTKIDDRAAVSPLISSPAQLYNKALTVEPRGTYKIVRIRDNYVREFLAGITEEQAVQEMEWYESNSRFWLGYTERHQAFRVV